MYNISYALVRVGRTSAINELDCVWHAGHNHSRKKQYSKDLQIYDKEKWIEINLNFSSKIKENSSTMLVLT